MIDLFLPFLLYSFLGFLLELLHARVHGSRGHGRKCLLFLPLCPVYGFGTLAILHMPAPLLNNPLTVFLAGGLLATLVEYGVALFYQVGAGVKFWDYSQQPGNLGGKICPLYTLFWGLLSLPQVYVFHPFLRRLLDLAAGLPAWLLQLLFLFFAADSLVSLWLLHRTGSTDCLMWYCPPLQPRRQAQ